MFNFKSDYVMDFAFDCCNIGKGSIIQQFHQTTCPNTWYNKTQDVLAR